MQKTRLTGLPGQPAALDWGATRETTMYFDFDYYWRVLRHVWKLQDYPAKPKMLLRLLVVVPLVSAIHAVFFLLDYIFFPRLWSQQMRTPVFIVGHGRSGTTLLHRLLAADEKRFSYPLYWEMFFPSLLEKKIIRGLGWLDQRALGGACKRKLVAWDDKTFGPYRHMHYMSLWASEEDCFAMTAAFVTQQWSLDIPMMDVIDIFHVDQMPQKRKRWLHHYRELMKRQLLLNGGDKVHLAKNPVMSGWVESLIEAFPDARILVMVRDPVQCIPSVLKLVEVAWGSRGWTREDYGTSLDLLTDIAFEHFHNPHRVLALRPDTPHMFVDYRDLTSDPQATVKAVYAALGMTMTRAYESWLAAQADRERTHNSKFEYSIDDYDLSLQRIETELETLYQRYEWPRPSAAGTVATEANHETS